MSASFLRIQRRVGIRDHQPDVVPHNPNPLESKRVDGRVDALGRGLHVDAARRYRRIAEARQIGRDHGETRREHFCQRLPHARRFSIAVDQNHWRPAATDGDAQGASVDGHGMGLESGPEFGGARGRDSDEHSETAEYQQRRRAQTRKGG